MIGYQVQLNLTGIFQKYKMPTWNEICQVLDELRILIPEVQIELADPATVQPRSYMVGHNGQVWRCIPSWLGE